MKYTVFICIFSGAAAFTPIARLKTCFAARLKASSAATQGTSSGDEFQGEDQRNVNSVDAISPDLIALQIGRAIRRWDDAFAKNYFDKSTYDNVLDELKKGKVPPIYHTLCRDPTKRLFLPNAFVSDGNENSGTITISANFAKAGVSIPHLEGSASSVEAIWKKNEFSYLEVFFGKDGQALCNVRDNLINGSWEFDEDITNTVTKLVNSKADMVGYDVEVTELPSEFPVDFSNGKNLITRSLSRGVVADCFERSKKRSIHAIVGSPGIGKSWTLIYALQQALLFENACVMLCIQKEEVAWVCIRKNHCIFAWIMESDYFETKCKSGLFRNSNLLVLLDPRESVDGGASFSQGNRRLIFAASNNGKHFSTLLPKTTAFAKRYLDPFTVNELKVATPYVIDDKSYSIDTILERAKVVGCLLRYVIDEDMFKERKKAQNEFIEEVRNQKLDLTAIFNWNGMIKEKDTVPGTIFVVSVKKFKTDEDLGDVSKDVDNDEEKDDDESYQDVGYDGEHIQDYGEMVVSIISSEIYLKLTNDSRAYLLSYLGKVSSSDLAKMGDVVEDLFWKDLQNKNVKMKCWKAGDNVDDLSEIAFEPTTILSGITFQDLTKKVFGNGKQVVCRMTDGFSLIDFAASPFSVIQVTVSPPENHQHKLSGVKSFLLAIGFLEYDTTGNLVLTKNIIEEKIKFFWAVPFSIRKQWINKEMKKNRGKGITRSKNSIDFKDYDVVNDCYKKYVDSYVILIENEPILKSDERNE